MLVGLVEDVLCSTSTCRAFAGSVPRRASAEVGELGLPPGAELALCKAGPKVEEIE